MYTGVTRLFSESGVVERALDTASTFDVSLGAPSCVFDEESLLGGLVEYAEVVGGVVLRGRRLRRASRGMLFVVIDRALWRGSRKDHLAAGSILKAVRYISRAAVCLE